MRVRVLLVSLLFSFGVTGALGSSMAVASTPPPDSTTNEFIPQERAIGDCISAVPKPGCGSESRSDWHQWLVLIALAGGMAFVGWRVVAGLRRQRTEPDPTKAPTRQL